VAHMLDSNLPSVGNLPEHILQLAKTIADQLQTAKRPVIISGVSCQTASIMKAAADVAWALHGGNENARLALTLSDSNSMGLAMMGGHRLKDGLDAVLNGLADTVIIMENDLYRHGRKDLVDKFLTTARSVITIDHVNHLTAQQSHVIIPAGTFADSDGTLVNNEGRAQRFFQVYEAGKSFQESWRWILDIARTAQNSPLTNWKNFEDITLAISEHEPLLKGIETINPPASFRVAGQKIPRQPHRYSGRTAMNAHHAVSEVKPPEDPDSPLSYTMEGLRALPPSSMIPFFWAPGWNSVQSVNKYQEEIGAALRGGDPGLRLLKPSASAKYFSYPPEQFRPLEGRLYVVPLHHIYGSEELSVRSASVASRAPNPYVMISEADSQQLNLMEGDPFHFIVDHHAYKLPVKINSDIPKGVAGLPIGLNLLPFVDLPAWAILTTQSVSERMESLSTREKVKT
jgi:NADH-quinone oxidoreductase subunit G